jgi:hypothetical protein
VRRKAVLEAFEEFGVKVIAVGHSAVAYRRLTGRKKPVLRFVEP